MSAFLLPGEGDMSPDKYSDLVQDPELAEATGLVVSEIAAKATAIQSSITSTRDDIATAAADTTTAIEETKTLVSDTASQTEERMYLIRDQTIDSVNTIINNAVQTSFIDGELRSVSVNPFLPPGAYAEPSELKWETVSGMLAITQSLTIFPSAPRLVMSNIASGLAGSYHAFKQDLSGFAYAPLSVGTASDSTGFSQIRRYFHGLDTSDILTVSPTTICNRFAGSGNVENFSGDWPAGFSATNTTDNYLYCFGSVATGLNSVAYRIDLTTGARTTIANNPSIYTGFCSTLKIGDKIIFFGGAAANAASSNAFGFNGHNVSTGSTDIWVYDCVANTYTKIATGMKKFLFNGRQSSNFLAHVNATVYAFIPSYYAEIGDSGWTQNTTGKVFYIDFANFLVNEFTGLTLGSINETDISLYYYGGNPGSTPRVVTKSRKVITFNMFEVSNISTVTPSGASSGNFTGFPSSYLFYRYILATCTPTESGVVSGLYACPFYNYGFNGLDFENQATVLKRYRKAY